MLGNTFKEISRAFGRILRNRNGNRNEEQASYKLRETLYKEMLESNEPYLINAQLNDLEYRLGIDFLYSFPTYVTLSMTTVCNARCTFCHYVPKRRGRDFVVLEDIKKMGWLKYVSTLNLNAGLSDSLVNPDFLEIFTYIREAFPHLKLTLVTNGFGLTEEIGKAFVGNLSELLVSINASKKETHWELMRSTKFDHVLEMISYITRLKSTYNTDKPLLAVSMVLFKDNLDEAVEFVELAHRIGADRIVFTHYYLTALTGVKVLDKSQSLYYSKELSDKVMEKASIKADELGIEIIKPLPFSHQNAYISFGDRVDHPSSPCTQPWTNFFLSSLAGEERHREANFCCFGFFPRITYDKSNLTEENFRRIWNHPVMRYFRRTVNANGNGANLICNLCQNNDRFDPKHQPMYTAINEITDPIFVKVDENFTIENIEQEMLEASKSLRKYAIDR